MAPARRGGGKRKSLHETDVISESYDTQCMSIGLRMKVNWTVLPKGNWLNWCNHASSALFWKGSVSTKDMDTRCEENSTYQSHMNISGQKLQASELFNDSL